MYIVLGGQGMQGRAIVHYLLEATDDNIVVMDLNTKNIENSSRVKCVDCNISNVIDKLGSPSDVVINCLPTEFNFDVACACARQRLHLVDLGGVTSVVREQFKLDREMEERGLTMIPDCGLAPGIISSVAAKLIDEGENLQSIKIYCGGLPKFPELPLSYIEVFYLGGVIKEYSGIAQELKSGKIVNYPTLTGLEKIFVPSLGILEAARTSGGISTSVDELSIQNLSYKTLRYPGHWNYIKKNILSQQNPLEVLRNMVKPVSADNPDIVVLIFKLEYHDGSEEIVDYYWEYDYDNNISAMAQATGYTAAAIATLINDGFVRSGVVGMHEIDADKIIERADEVDGEQYISSPFIFEEDE